MVKIAQQRYQRYYDSLYEITHVHPLVHPYAFFQVGLSILVDCNFGAVLKKRILNSCPMSSDLASKYWLYVGSYCLLRDVFDDMAVSSNTFNAQFVRWLSKHLSIESFIDTVVDCEVENILQLAVMFYGEDSGFFKRSALC